MDRGVSRPFSERLTRVRCGFSSRCLLGRDNAVSFLLFPCSAIVCGFISSLSTTDRSHRFRAPRTAVWKTLPFPTDALCDALLTTLVGYLRCEAWSAALHERERSQHATSSRHTPRAFSRARISHIFQSQPEKFGDIILSAYGRRASDSSWRPAATHRYCLPCRSRHVGSRLPAGAAHGLV